MADCIFCKISNKQIPSQVVYEDSDVLAFKDISPASEGHTLVITKTHFADIFDVAPDLLRKSIETAQQIAQKMKTEQKLKVLIYSTAAVNMQGSLCTISTCI